MIDATNADKSSCKCRFHVHIVDLSDYFSLMLLKEIVEKFDIISFGIVLGDTVENYMFDMMGAKAC